MTSRLNYSRLQYLSSAAGFQNVNDRTGFANIPAQNIAAGTVVWFDGPYAMPNTNNISALRVKFDGLETFWREVNGYTFTRLPTYAAPDYEVGVVSYYSGGNHHLFCYIVNDTAGAIVVPAWTLRYTLNLYDAPF